jgi:hypothetical protein
MLRHWLSLAVIAVAIPAFGQAPVQFATSQNTQWTPTSTMQPAALQVPLQVPTPIPPPMEICPTLPPADGGIFPVGPPPPPVKLWKGSFDAGLNGATGNSGNFNARIFWDANRKTDVNLFHSDMTYLLGKDTGKTNQNTMILNARDEILTPGSPWTIFLANYVDYDELRDYKFYVGLFGGLGYIVSDTDDLKFRLRGGLGTVYKTGARFLDDEWTPQLDLGYDFRWKVGERSALISTMDYYPSLDEGFGHFTLRLKVAYECTLDPKTCTFFRTGIFERYDTDPGPGFRKSDLNYFMSLGFNF